jgi:hypothetical protein
MSVIAYDARFWRPNTLYRSGLLVFVSLEFYAYYTQTATELEAFDGAGNVMPFSFTRNYLQANASASWNGYGWISQKVQLVFAFKDQATANATATIHGWLWVNSYYVDYI